MNVPNVMSLKITIKYVFKEMCSAFESCAFAKILRMVPFKWHLDLSYFVRSQNKVSQLNLPM